MTCTRIWLGPEREGFSQGTQTLFYEDSSPDGKEVVNLLKEYPQVKRVYLGAGRKYPSSIINSDELQQYASEHEVEVVVEVQIPSSCIFPKSWTIIGVCGKELPITYLKTDDGKVVNIYKLSNPVVTDLADLSNGLFSCDTMIKEM